MHHLAVHLIESYQYLGLYILLALGLVGLPIPDETVMTYAGFQVYQGRLSLLSTLLTCLGGSLTGMSISYWLGRLIGLPLLLRYGGYIRLTPDRLEKGERWFRRYRGKSIIFSYFVPGLRHLSAYFAGISIISYPAFLALAAAGGAGWVLLFVALGFVAGEDWVIIGPMVHRYLWLGLGLGAAGLLVYLAVKKKRRVAP